MPQGAIANGTIAPMRFVKLDATAAGGALQVLVCGAGDRSIGISQRGTRRNQYIDSNNNAALINEPIQYFDLSEECFLELGGTVTAMDRIKSGALGVGVTATSDGDAYGAIALASGVSGDLIPVKVVSAERGA